MKILYDYRQIQIQTKNLAKNIEKDFNKEEPLICVCVLKGAVMFYVELLKHIDRDIRMDFMTLSSYLDSKEPITDIRCLSHIRLDVKGQNVLVVDDVIDTGGTVKFLRDYFIQREVKKLKICAMMDKVNARKVDVNVDYAAFKLDCNDYLVGFGLDYAQKYRNLHGIYILN